MNTEETNNQKLGQSLFYLTIIIGGAVYLAYRLNWGGILISLALILGLIWLFAVKFDWHPEKPKFSWPPKAERQYLLLLLILWTGGLWLLYRGQTSASIISPWQQVSGYFFPLYLAATALVARAAWRGSWAWRTQVKLHYLFSFSVAIIVYRLGQGFDPFIHQAAARYIAEHGFVSPKTLYYAGQYALEVLANKLFFIPIALADALLVPLTAAWLLPSALENAAGKMFADVRSFRLISLTVLALGFSALTITTPQNLAFVLAAVSLLLAMTAAKKDEWFLAFLAALAALVVQPIAGLPALLTVVAFWLRQTKLKNSEPFYAAIFASTATIIPLAFYWLERDHFSWIQFMANLSSSFSISYPILPNQENWLLNFVYLAGFNNGWLLGLLALAGLFFLASKGRRVDWPAYLILASQAAALLLAYIFTNALSFGYLIDYERGNYAARLLTMAGITAAPLAIILFYEFAKRWQLLKNTDWLKLGWGLLALALIGCNLYLAYPRQDNWQNSRGFSVSQQDIDTVNWINQDARNTDYIVLANQQVSAASLKQFGFAKYYQNDLFYYPIPTGGPLYQFFLAMNKKPERAIAERAMELAGVNRVYYVVNNYWWGSDKIGRLARVDADRVEQRDGSVIFIYQHQMQTPIAPLNNPWLPK
ncbi:MAG: hypothetical protein WCO55_02015 [Candidatus Falkowbacteria bacterium]